MVKQSSSSSSYVVPSWDVIIEEENPAAITQSKPNHHHILPTVDYEVAELTWKDGHLGMHAFGVPKLHSKTKDDNIYTLALASSPGHVPERCSWDKPLAGGGTLESIVNQATTTPLSNSGTVVVAAGGEQLVTSRFDSRKMPLPVNAMSCLVGSSTLVGSCSVTPTLMEEGKQVRAATHDWSSRVDQSGTIFGSSENRHASQDTCDTGGFTIYTSASLGSPGNTTSSAKDGTKNAVDEHDSVCHSRNQGGDKEEDKKRVTVLGKRIRCAAVHNQSERKRRDKINQRMSILQKLVPNSSKTDKASMLDEVIEYMKQLQHKVEMMNSSMSPIMLPLPLSLQQQQLRMSFMSSPPPMGSINMACMDINHQMTRPGMPTSMPQGFYPNIPFMPTTMASWDHNNMPQSTTSMPSISAASFLAASQSHPQPSMTMDAYSRMAAMYHQLQVPPAAAPPASDNIKGI